MKNSNYLDSDSGSGAYSEFNHKTKSLMQELIGDKNRKKDTKKEKKQFDWHQFDEKRTKNMAEFNDLFDNTLLQMGDESEQITMNNSTFFEIVNDPVNIN